MSSSALNASDAAKRLGVSTKALRLYEERGLIRPLRTEAGWRVYGAEELARAAEIVALRALGLSLAEVARVVGGDRRDLERALAEHQTSLDRQHRELGARIEKVHRLRAELARGEPPEPGELACMLRPALKIRISFALPWPWGGETFALDDVLPLTYIVGPLGSGKTRLAMRLAEALPGGALLGLDRLADDGAAARARLAADSDLKARVDRALAWLTGDGATISGALIALLAGLETDGPVVVDMVEDGLDQVTQEALVAYLRQRAAAPLVLMTRSSAILDLTAVGPDEMILLCPANHSPPFRVAPWPGAHGYDALATCLASPEVRARTRGVSA